MKHLSLLFTILLAGLFLAGCGGGAASTSTAGLPVVATTSIVADVVRQVGGEHVQVTLLLPLGTDPHTFEARPQDAVALAETEIVFANGAGLEEFLLPLLESTGALDKLVEVSRGIELLTFEQAVHESEEAHEAEEGHEHESGDPHTWMDPNNVITWVENIRAALTAADPGHAAEYQANADAYQAELRDLDAWIRVEVGQVPAGNRNLVSDHAVLGYFAEEYGFTQLGTITISFSTGASTSARDMAMLEDAIREFGVKAVFVGMDVNQDLAAQVAADTGIRMVALYHGSLTDEEGEAATYLDFMGYNVEAIVEALK